MGLKEGKDQKLKRIWKGLDDGTVSASQSSRKPQSLAEEIKLSLCREICNFRYERRLKNKEMAEIIKVTEPQFSAIAAQRIDMFTIDFLVDKIEIMKKEEARKTISGILSLNK